MNVQKTLNSIEVVPDKETRNRLLGELREFLKLLKNAAHYEKISADFFVGGSFAKGTLMKKEKYDIDIFARFDWRYQDLTSLLAIIVKRACGKRKVKIVRLHGSRDYFQIFVNKEILFEIVPVLKIKKPKEARNVTDLSYFHVSYVKNKLRGNSKILKEIAVAKAFCKAQGVYGAESYIGGFSGYALECLVIHYKSFLKMIKNLLKVKDKLIIDPANHYKNKSEVMVSLNEGKLQGPIILIDPTWKERNVLAALSKETFLKFQKSARNFLRFPGEEFFTRKEVDIQKLKKETKEKKASLIELIASTNRQPGDIAGTKLKKFSNFLIGQLQQYYEIIRCEFIYDGEQSARVLLIIKEKNGIKKIGPPVSLEKHAKAFRRKYDRVYEKNGRLCADIAAQVSAKKFIIKFMLKYKEIIKSMQIEKLKVL